MAHYDDPTEEAERRILEVRKSNALSLDLSHLNIGAIPESLYRLVELQYLYLNDNQISAITESVCRLINLKTLDLRNNRISIIPESVCQLVNLRTVGLSGNQISATPKPVGQLANLKYLYLSNNQIRAISEALGQLYNLQELYVQGNKIKAIPEFVSQLVNLKTLDLRDNRIIAIPEALGQLANLRTLGLSGNQISVIPESIGQLSNLKILDLSNNQITALPEVLGNLPKLTGLYLHGNTGLGIPEEILGPIWRQTSAEGKKPKLPREILNYSRSLANARPLNEAKLILVGQGTVGKTSLAKTLSTGKFKKREKATEGIKISDWLCPIAGNSKVKVHIWDFGGQEMMHATHQFFLTSRSLYLLVLNRRQGGCDREADYWFRLIRAFGGQDAPVIVVLNKQKSEPFDVNRGGWLEKYAGNIKGFVETDCEDAKSITHLKRKIQEELQKMNSLKVSFPRRWFEIKDELSQMSSAYITFEDYRVLCRKHKEDDLVQQSFLAGFLHDLGIALNYKDDLRLRFAYVLKPEWVTEGIYALLHAFVTSRGLFSHAQAEKVLTSKGYTTEAVLFIMGLMEKFELSFPLGDGQKRVLIPQLLDDQQPDQSQRFKPAECLNFGYQYSIVPEGLLPRFIVRTHHLSEPATRWKSGVILHHASSGCTALVRSDATEGLVRIHIDGSELSRPQLLAIIRHNFEAIHADYEFKPVELVYAQGLPDKPSPLDELEAFLRSGITTIPVKLPDNTATVQNITSLIEPVRSAREPLKVFLSYAHKDEEYLDELRKDLKLMERNGIIRVWSDRAISTGDRWEQKILQELEAADVVVCQLSRDFLASDFCTLIELDTAIKRKTAGEAALIAYVLKECGWKEVPQLRQFQLLPKDVKPLSKWKKDEYWRAIAEGIQQVLENLQNSLPRRSEFSRSAVVPR